MMKAPRYVLGIDLGTTNTVVSFCETDRTDGTQWFEVPQMVGDGELSALRSIASAAFVETESLDIRNALPWSGDGLIIGKWAKLLGSTYPERVIHSAKSWLSYSGVDRSAPILPWGGLEGSSRKRSPVEISAAILAHVKAAWNHRYPKSPIHKQDVILTVPASFDDTARRLTVGAAREAGLGPNLYLLEEPQAAFYANLEGYEAELGEAGLVMVIDVGGGTTDLTLIRAQRQDGGQLDFERVAVGDHLLLGGDNMDLFLAYEAERRILGRNGSLNSRMMSQLVAICRDVKETGLSPDAPPEFTVALPGRGRRLIQGVKSCTFSSEELASMLLNAFVPDVPFDSQLNARRGMALSALGLPYEQEPILTKHVADFIRRHSQYGFPTHILFNGGFFRSELIRQSLWSTICTWASDQGNDVALLAGSDLDGAVSKGATHFGLARHGLSRRIGGGCTTNYLVSVERRNRKGKKRGRTGVCLLPKGTETSRKVAIKDQVFNLVAGRPVQMTVAFGGSEPLNCGERVDLTIEGYRRLGSVQTVVDAHEEASQVPVTLSASISEQGLLELSAHAVDRDEVYEFEFRSESESTDTVEPELSPTAELKGDFEKVEALVLRVFGKPDPTADPKEIRYLTRSIEGLIGMPRDQWGVPELRRIADYLIRGMRRRRRSERHEMTFLHLFGFCVRPGLGDSFDEWRIHRIWTLFHEGVHFHQRLENWDAWWIAWRRISGGLSPDQQRQIYQTLSPWLIRVVDKTLTKKDKLKQPNEAFRLLASLEHLDKAEKNKWAERFLMMSKVDQYQPFALWCLARIGARELVYGGAERTVSPAAVEGWIQTLLNDGDRTSPFFERCLVSLCRCTGDRQRDVPFATRERVAIWLEGGGSDAALISAVREPTELKKEETQRLLGDTLPDGLRLIS